MVRLILVVLLIPAVLAEEWWSLQPLRRPPVPQAGEGWARGDIDRFIAAAHREHQLAPAPEADRRTLIRRLYFDLIGLPPTPEAVAAFEADPRPDAYTRLVDELLDSPHYGERWARHWLDVVHYGDTHGYDKDKLRRNAWPYRDYVIRSFNDDTPYSRFIQEQLAGDILDPKRPDLVAATGFIVAGPWDFIGHVEVPGSKIDGKVARNLDRDDMVVNTIQTFNSLTIQCARCHDHKSDPFSKEDYYSLQAIFAAIGRNDRPFDVNPATAKKRDELLAQQRQLEAKARELRKTRDSRISPEIKAIDAQLKALAKSPAAKGPRSERYGYHSQGGKTADSAKWVQVDLGRPVSIDRVMLFAADEWGWADFGFPDAYKVEASNRADFSRGLLLHEGSERPGSAPVVIDGKNSRSRYVRVTATKLWNRRQQGQPLTDDWFFALGELVVLSGGTNVARGAAVKGKDSIEAGHRWAAKNLTDGVLGTHPAHELRSGKSPSNGYHSQFSANANSEKWVQLDFGEVRKLGRVTLQPAFPTDWQDTPGFGFPLRFTLEASNDPSFAAATTLRDESAADFANPGNSPVIISASNTSARYLRLTASKLWDRGGKKHALALAEISIDGAHPATVTASDSIDQGRWHTRFLSDRHSSRTPLGTDAELFDSLLIAPDAAAKIASLQAQRATLVSQALPEKHVAAESANAAELDAIQKSLATLPQAGKVYAAATHFKGQGQHKASNGKPVPIHVLARGQVTKPGELVGPRALPLPGLETSLQLADGHAESARRLALANWLIDRRHPLTWRSIVNRIWHYHFGRGIVNSPNDFGKMGEAPTHPELLDWLAAEFRDGGQSFKALHRLIVNSATYRQQTTHHDAHAAIDTGNQYYWRMNRRRLTAEEIRDSVLQVSGKLDSKMGGPGFFDFVLEKTAHSPHYEYHKHDANDPKTHRRSIYRFLVRSQPQPFMNTMDCADPSISVPSRGETFTALQALAMFNNPFVIAMSQHFANSARHTADPAAYLLSQAFSRPPTDREVRKLANFANEHGLESAARALFNSNEFLFVE